MSVTLKLDTVLDACGNDGRVSGICIDSELEPVGGVGTPVKPAIYSGPSYQHDKRWGHPESEKAADVIIIDNVHAQANRLEGALDINPDDTGIPRFILDFTGDEFAHLPSHLPRQKSSLHFSHRHADAYLRDSLINGKDTPKTKIGQDLRDATTEEAAAIVAWFPQSLLFGFWQSHLGNNRSQAKHARSWTSEIIGWHPATGGNPDELTRAKGTKGDFLNLQNTAKVSFDKSDKLSGWEYVAGEKSGKIDNKKTDSLSNIGHGQVPFDGKGLAPVSFRSITQRAICSFAQIRRIHLGKGYNPGQDQAARALLVALGLRAHQLAFGEQGFALRSGTDLVPVSTKIRVRGSHDVQLDGSELLGAAYDYARTVGVPLDGWYREPIFITPNKSLTAAILGSWPILQEL